MSPADLRKPFRVKNLKNCVRTLIVARVECNCKVKGLVSVGLIQGTELVTVLQEVYEFYAVLIFKIQANYNEVIGNSQTKKARMVTKLSQQLEEQLGCAAANKRCVKEMELTPGSIQVNSTIATTDTVLAGSLKVRQTLILFCRIS